MLKFLVSCLLPLCFLGSMRAQAQQTSTILIQPVPDENILVSTDKPVYFPGDTLRLAVQREDSTATSGITPIVPIEGLKLMPAGHAAYLGVIPQTVIPGSYRILLRTSSNSRGFAVSDSSGNSMRAWN